MSSWKESLWDMWTYRSSIPSFNKIQINAHYSYSNGEAEKNLETFHRPKYHINLSIVKIKYNIKIKYGDN